MYCICLVFVYDSAVQKDVMNMLEKNTEDGLPLQRERTEDVISHFFIII
jgi:hypothetical protein